MKKTLVALMAMVMLSSTAAFAASDTPISDWINSKTSKITQREKSAAAKAEAKRKKREAKIQKQKRKQAEAKRKAEQRQKERKQKIEKKKRLWNELFSAD